MAPKRARQSSYAGYDTKKFVSLAARDRYTQSLVHKVPIPERGFDLHPSEDAMFHNVIVTRRWVKFCRQPQAAVMPVVREFYANAAERTDGSCFVRGCQVPFDGKAINEFYETPNIGVVEYSALAKGEVNLEDVVKRLCRQGITDWKITKGEFISFKTNTLIREAKVWMHFISAKMLPSTHVSDVTKDRAILLYAILSGKSIDIGQFLFTNILRTACSTREGLWFPSLITGLCAKAGVKWDQSEELLHPKGAIDGTVIYRLIKGDNDDEVGGTGSPSAQPTPQQRQSQQSVAERLESIERRLGSASAQRPPQPPPPPPLQRQKHRTAVERLESIERQLDRLYQFITYSFQCNQAFEQMLRINAGAGGVDLSTYPTLPHPPFGPTEPYLDKEEEEVKILSSSR